ncbi:hypothetical protein [Halorussus sp. AFM4]|uniref:hypothetical protein n=1 Tax=Halorussus sp. AFM4 TaxID=3421651 RepID=UPI003EBA2425
MSRRDVTYHSEWAAKQRRQRRRERAPERRRIHAHQSVRQDWTRHHDDCPDGVRREVWINPFFEPETFVSEKERRFVQTRKMRRRRMVQWEGYQPGDRA